MTLSVWVRRIWFTGRATGCRTACRCMTMRRMCAWSAITCISAHPVVARSAILPHEDILNGPFERIPGTFDFWDPNLFLDDDGKLYFYWGCNNVTPIWGVELEPETMVPKTERKELIYGQPEKIGYERVGENHSKMPLSEEEAVEKFKEFLKAQGKDADHLTEEQIGFAKIMFSQRPFIEGAWMTKHDGTYYLRVCRPGNGIQRLR